MKMDDMTGASYSDEVLAEILENGMIKEKIAARNEINRRAWRREYMESRPAATGSAGPGHALSEPSITARWRADANREPMQDGHKPDCVCFGCADLRRHAERAEALRIDPKIVGCNLTPWQAPDFVVLKARPAGADPALDYPAVGWDTVDRIQERVEDLEKRLNDERAIHVDDDASPRDYRRVTRLDNPDPCDVRTWYEFPVSRERGVSADLVITGPYTRADIVRVRDVVLNHLQALHDSVDHGNDPEASK